MKHNGLVDQHNDLVDQHNDLVDQHKWFGGSTQWFGGSTQMIWCINTNVLIDQRDSAFFYNIHIGFLFNNAV